MAQLDQWLDAPGETGWVVVTGGPGMGKSAILSAWLARREATGALVPHHFARRQVADWDQPKAIAASLAVQIEAAFPALRDAEAKPERRLIELLGRVSRQLGPAGRLVVVVDGLDETCAEPGENPLPHFLPHVMLAGISFLCATRPTYPHLNWLEAHNLVRRLDLDSLQWVTSNTTVVRSFWEGVASEYQPPLPAEMMTVAIARAEGNVLHAVMLHDTLRALPSGERRTDRIPRGIKSLLGEVWDRAASHEAVRVGLGLLCAAQEALSLDMLAELAGWSYDDKHRFVRDARQLLLEEPASWAGVDAYRPRHEWVRELIAEQLGAATVRAHHAALSRTLATWPARLETTERRYSLRHALVHRAEAGAWTDAWQLASDMGFLGAKCHELGVHELEADVTRMAERCRTNGDALTARRFSDLARALGRESHWLRTAPEATAALVWNRLRRFGWSTDDIDGQLQIPDEASFLRVRRVVTRESAALIRDLVGHSGSVTACAVTANGRRVVSASDNRTLKIWDLESGHVLATLQGHTERVRACTVTADGRRVVSASDDRTLKVWDLESGRVLATLEGHADGVTACAVTADSRHLVSASDDRTLKVWDLESGSVLATLEGHIDRVRACAVAADGRRMVSASDDRTLKVWDLESGSVLSTLEGHVDRVRACAVTADGRRVISASNDRTLKIWDLESGRVLATLEGHIGGVNACAVTADGRRVVSASFDGILKVWSLESGHTLNTMEGHTHWVTACTVTADGRRVISGSQDRTLKVWDLKTGRALATLQGHTDWVRACTVTADGRYVVSGAQDGTLKVWDLKSGRALATMQGHTEWVTACAATVDGRCVVSASADATLKVWDLKSGRALTTMQGHTDWVLACAVMTDGRRVVSASEDGTLKVWDLKTGRELATLQGHTDRVRACAVTPDGRRVVSASADRTLKVWDLKSGREIATLQGHTDRVRACAVTPDGRRVVSASEDAMLRVWDLRTFACVLTHRGDAPYRAVAASTTAIIAGDSAGGLWFLNWSGR